MKRSVAIVGMALLCAVGFFGLNTLNQPKGFDTDSISDPTEYLAGVPGDTVVATVNGQAVTAEEYFYWVGYTAETAEYYMGGELDWTMGEGDGTILDYVKQTSLETCKLYSIVAGKAEEMGCGLTEENLVQYQASYDQTVAQLGGEEEAKKWLLQVGLDEEGFRKVNTPTLLYQNMLSSLLTEEAVAEEDLAEYVETADVLRAKHILLMTMDPNTRQPLSEEQQTAKKEQAEEIFAQLEESEDPLALFDELMHQYSEDTGLATNPNGYLFTANQMVPQFEQGTRDLEYNEISGVIQSDYGYHIILRLDPAEDESFVASVNQTLSQTKAQNELDTMLSDWLAEAEVETAEIYDTLDVPAYYSNMKALRAEIAAVEQELAEAQQK